MPVDFRLVIANLAVLPVVLVFLSLDLIADHCAGAQAEAAANGGTGGRMSDHRADDATDSGATERADDFAIIAECSSIAMP